MQHDFPQKSDYPNSLSILDNPYEDIDLYMRLCVSSASVYFETDPVTNHLFKKCFYIARDHLERLGKRQFRVAIDVGCGIGFFLPILASHADRVTALDYSDDILEYARFMSEQRGMKNADFVRGTINAWQMLRSSPKPFESPVFTKAIRDR